MKLKNLLWVVVSLIFVLSFSSSYAAGVIKIGVQAPITGPFANEGQGIDNAVKMLVEQQNAKGGLLGKKLEVVTCDDEGTAVGGAICARKLVNDGVIAVIGTYSSTPAESAEPIYARAGVLQTSDATADSLTKHGYWTFFRNSCPNSAEATFTADFLVKKMHFKRIVVLSDYSTYSSDLADATVAALKKIGGNVIYKGKIQAGSQNFTPILTKIKAMNPDVIYFSGYYTDGGLIRAQQVALGIKAAFVGGDSNDNPEFFKLAGKSANGVYMINVPRPDILPYPLAKEFLRDYQAKYHMMPPSIWTLFNADGLRAIMYAIEKTKTTDTKKLAAFLHNLKNFPGITGPITFTKDGERAGSRFMAYEIYNNNQYKVVYKED
ncbi:MAG: branched-chain amino acid ABC transporter substrate-binding protein [Desulfurella sp.]|jgi:branched-chain amino acid transport system substrate-binding protein|uniref:Branched-chain amino acid transport system substrate-binding protein n=1 Tax=Desulfurella multipotens TaxID=79269 RepID=A0A1G6KQI7_9BACT|nr:MULTISPECIES: branched-chain amino acid ABC transporter substrate-binding protein [Desulfurella]AHF96762.1 branched-chain amino acid ABC transporter substrate-binding protein [Desulfurella acetivorans A63]HEX13033.1 branched-chain amino acid ABC transporter substrate-binding protein [Desulfurella acetivorans]PMP62838.1 MAG: branched-chain amino acid ABC transporter substrate-binding protein [Desulfurella multipotens]PMP92421.1 MAG: branched-chain amino acid ABC transporter substrate-binding 